MKPHALASLILLSLAPARSEGQEPPPAEPASLSIPDAVQGITPRELGAHMRFLASDLMRGRDTTSPETRIAAEYLASRLIAAGAEPAGDPGRAGRTFFQRFPLEVTTPDLAGTSVTLIQEHKGTRREIACAIGTDLTLSPRGLLPGTYEAPVVFVGHGTEAEYEGLEVAGRFVLALEGPPPGKSPGGEAAEERPRPRRSFPGAGSGKADAARKRGALGVLVVNPRDAGPPASPGFPEAGQLGFDRASMTLWPADSSLPSLVLSNPIREQVLTPASSDQLGVVEGLRVRLTFAAKREQKSDQNVVGLFPGSDPARAKEVVIFSAHYDHVGVNDRGEIFNGADDNASGTSALIEIAEAIGAGPRPARSVAFLWVSGEEKGLLGSKWFADHVSLPDDYRIVADINLDMVSRNDGKAIGITPSESHPEHNSLSTLAKATCQAEGLEPTFDIDQYFGRTDSASFARKGIPVVFFFNGVHEDYHRPTDDVEKADFDKAARVARAAYRLGWQAAQAAEAPRKSNAKQTP